MKGENGNVVLENGLFRAEISPRGAELRSFRRLGDPSDGETCEYVWQGDPQFWADRAPVLFPICGRLPGGRDGHYFLGGKRHEMTIHGFIRRMDADVESKSPCSAAFTFRDNAETRAQYPFPFQVELDVSLAGDTLRWETRVRNTGSSGVLPFAFGFHPGFNVPLAGNGGFSDWSLVFGSSAGAARRVVFSPAPACLWTGRDEAFPLEGDGNGGHVLRLSHSLFDDDAIFLKDSGPEVTLRSDKSRRSVTLSTEGFFPYLGIWHAPRAEAPYVCLEPWTGLPSRDGAEEDFATKEPFFRLAPGEEKFLRFGMRFS